MKGDMKIYEETMRKMKAIGDRGERGHKRPGGRGSDMISTCSLMCENAMK